MRVCGRVCGCVGLALAHVCLSSSRSRTDPFSISYHITLTWKILMQRQRHTYQFSHNTGAHTTFVGTKSCSHDSQTSVYRVYTSHKGTMQATNINRRTSLFYSWKLCCSTGKEYRNDESPLVRTVCHIDLSRHR